MSKNIFTFKTCSHKTLILDNASKKTQFIKIFLVSNSTLEELFNDATHLSLRWINISTGQNWLNKKISI